MIVNGSSIQGIFKYSDNYTFEKGDLVVGSNTALYYVNCDEIQGVDPASDLSNQYYIPYSRIQEATSVEQIEDYERNGNLLVTANLLAQYFTSLIGGIGADGSVDIIDYNSAEIALMKTNQIHYIRQATGIINVEVGDQIDSFPLAGKDFLLRVYKTRTLGGTNQSGTPYIYCAIQELVDFTEGRFFYRYAFIENENSTPAWSSYKYVGTSSEDSTLLNERFKAYKDLIDQVISKINFIQNNLQNFYSFYEATESNDTIGIFFNNPSTGQLTNPVLTVTNNFLNERGSILIVFVSYEQQREHPGLKIKESHFVNPFSSGTIITEHFSIEIRTVPSSAGLVRTDITFVPYDGITNLTIDKAIASQLSSLNIEINK